MCQRPRPSLCTLQRSLWGQSKTEEKEQRWQVWSWRDTDRANPAVNGTLPQREEETIKTNRNFLQIYNTGHDSALYRKATLFTLSSWLEGGSGSKDGPLQVVSFKVTWKELTVYRQGTGEAVHATMTYHPLPKHPCIFSQPIYISK